MSKLFQHECPNCKTTIEFDSELLGISKIIKIECPCNTVNVIKFDSELRVVQSIYYDNDSPASITVMNADSDVNLDEVKALLVKAGADVNMLDYSNKRASKGKSKFKQILLMLNDSPLYDLYYLSKSTQSKGKSKFKQILLTIFDPFVFIIKVGKLAVLVSGLYMLISPFYGQLTCTNETIAEVVNLSSHINDMGSSRSYAPTFSYNVNGEEIIVPHNVYLNPTPYKIGDTLTLFYNPNKLESYHIEGAKNWIFPPIGLILTVVSLSLLIAGFWIEGAKNWILSTIGLILMLGTLVLILAGIDVAITSIMRTLIL